MTNEEAARNLILMFTQWAANYDPGSEDLEKSNKAVQIAIYALGNATGNGIQFDTGLITDCIADGGVPCPHYDVTEYQQPTTGEIITKCNTCGQVLSRVKAQ